jgi:tRNA(adenine34) deaminase
MKEAKKGWLDGEVPVGALLIGQSNEIFARDHNRCISSNDPTAHAEILVIRQAAKLLKNYRLNGLNMVVTIEPCPMCMGAIINARLDMLVFGAFDPKSGAAGSIYNLSNNARLNHRLKVIHGIMEKECLGLMQEFFRERR